MKAVIRRTSWQQVISFVFPQRRCYRLLWPLRVFKVQGVVLGYKGLLCCLLGFIQVRIIAAGHWPTSALLFVWSLVTATVGHRHRAGVKKVLHVDWRRAKSHCALTNPACFLEKLGQLFFFFKTSVFFLIKGQCLRLLLHHVRFLFSLEKLKTDENMEVRKCVCWQDQELLYQSQEALLPGGRNNSHWLQERGLSSILLC